MPSKSTIDIMVSSLDFTHRHTNDTSVLASATLTSNAVRAGNKDPHLLLYAFLPVLLFGDAMSIVPRQLSTVLLWLFLQKNQQTSANWWRTVVMFYVLWSFSVDATCQGLAWLSSNSSSMHSLGRTENARAARDHVNTKWRIPIKLSWPLGNGRTWSPHWNSPDVCSCKVCLSIWILGCHGPERTRTFLELCWIFSCIGAAKQPNCKRGKSGKHQRLGRLRMCSLWQCFGGDRPCGRSGAVEGKVWFFWMSWLAHWFPDSSDSWQIRLNTVGKRSLRCQEMGASRVLTMQIAGESLLNDAQTVWLDIAWHDEPPCLAKCRNDAWAQAVLNSQGWCGNRRVAGFLQLDERREQNWVSGEVRRGGAWCAWSSCHIHGRPIVPDMRHH